MDLRTPPVSDDVVGRPPGHASLVGHAMSPDAPDQPRVPAAILAEVLDLLPDAVTVLDFDLRVLYLNELAAAYLRHARVDPAASIGRPLAEAVGGILPDDYLRAIERAAAERRVVTIERHAIPLGRWIETRVVPSEHTLTLYSRDLTKRHDAERRAAESSALLHARSSRKASLASASAPASTWPRVTSR